jgi:hypothetical protein
MRFQVADPVPMPAQEVFLLIRDEMPKLVPFLHDIDRIEVASRREEGDVVHLLNVWYASSERVPGALKKFLKPEFFSWKDHASWTGATRSATWRLEPRAGASIFECSGTTGIEDAGSGTSRITMDIHLEVHPDKVPGIPGFIGRSLRGEVEEFVSKMLTPNMRNLAASVRKYAESRPR